ncbi:MAG: pentachlorophenol monooxygenase, partial [Rhodococcus sp.]|nr:pentachlorophenol monooxygenase [Rhodococcus sp. (in: high G+C Gram-positive bacteria)]
PIRLFDLLSGVDHTLLLTSDGSAESINSLEKVADAAIRSAHGLLDVYAIVPPGTVTVDSLVPIIEDNASQLCAAYGVEGTAALVIRPDGYLGFRGHPENVSDYFTKLFAVNQE